MWFEILLSILSFIAGSLVTWLVTWAFSRKGSAEAAQLRSIIEKMPTDLVDAIARDSRTKLTLRQFEDVAAVVVGIHARQQPRTISDEQRKTIVKALQSMTAGTTYVVAASNDIEAQSYRDQIATLFGEAGWPTTASIGAAANDVSGVAVAYYTGPSVWPRTKSSPPPEEEAICTAFTSAGIEAELLQIEDYAPGDFQYFVIVGQKPNL